ncbi:hypothetical protein [Bradyrhizobium sp. WSM1743]|uniref:hypothetical protein n=1 Tax=Bradyrhizobium sp. WSM1743 TaxID=318996 RepID=UPI00040E3B63|nr:hypothetical protein [Bradyrhizobium sp. WSM1743]
MAYQTKALTIVRANPAVDAQVFSVFGPGKVLLATGKKFDSDPANVWLNVIVPPGQGDGWLQRSNVDEVADPERQEIEPEDFVRQCILVERSFNVVPENAPWLVSADFLLARAQIETKIKNLGPVPGSDAVGPLRVSSAEWSDFLTNGKPLSDGYGPKDFDYPMLQVYAAGHRMRADAKAMSEQSLADANDPFIPSYLDLFHAYLTDVNAALAIRESEKDSTKKISDAVTHNQFASLKAREQFSALDESDTIPHFVSVTEALLNSELKSAFDLIKEAAPDELPQASPGEAPWLHFAEQEMQAGVSEATSVERIKSYFAATDFGPVHGSIPHWCGAFVAFCIKQSGHENSIPKGAALAAHWKQWGQSVPLGSSEIPVGAVIVLTPGENTNTSGHVAFFSEAMPATKQVKLLGGNQHNEVNKTPFSSSRISAIRWFETESSSAGAAGQASFNLEAAGIPQEFRQFGDMIVDRFSRSGFSKEQQLAALANAIGESGLDPNCVSPAPEKSFGLFQCNQKAGLGIGFTVEQLTNPEINIGIIIKESKKFTEFTSAHTVADAIRAFVKFIERPKHPEADIIKRMAIAEKLQKPI